MVIIVGVIPEDIAKKVGHHCIDTKQSIQDFVATVVREYIEKIEEKEKALAAAQFPAGMVGDTAASVAIQPEMPEIAPPAIPGTKNAEVIGTENTIDNSIVATAASDVQKEHTGAECKWRGSTNTKKKGVIGTRQRHFCNSCKRFFRTPLPAQVGS
jgi:hypothetical protein